MHDYIDQAGRNVRQAAAADHTSICHVKPAILSLARQTALERQDLSSTYLAHHELESKCIFIDYYYYYYITIIIIHC